MLSPLALRNYPDYLKLTAEPPFKELTMSIQDVLREIKATSAGPFPRTTFLIIFVGVVVGPLVMFAIGGRPTNSLGQPGLVWSFLAIALLILTGIGLGFWMFSKDARRVSISPKHP